MSALPLLLIINEKYYANTKAKIVLVFYPYPAARLAMAVVACHLQADSFGSVLASESSHGDLDIYCLMLSGFISIPVP